MRLIDADALLQDLKGSKKDLQEIYKGLMYDDEKRICGGEIVTFGECIMRVNNAPTVDIKTEVAREIFAEIEEVCRNYYEKLSKPTNSSLENMLFRGERFVVNEMRHDIAELKNKYIEGVGE